ncbi:MAG: hypothetical protein HY904_10145 [Deltaproteobacteria bacterium]|nr:hypothetical protein [Deltaproteobacteria bacterium]
MAGVKQKLRDEGLKLGMKAMSKLMEDPDRAQKLMTAVQKVQDGKQSLDETTARLRNTAGLPSREDFKTMGKRVGKLRRDVRKLASQLDGVLQTL